MPRIPNDLPAIFGALDNRVAQLERIVRAVVGQEPVSLEDLDGLSHDSLSDVTTDQHHAQLHDIDGPDHIGFPGGTTDFLRADGTFAAPPGGGGTPATTVTSETTFGISPVVGVDTDYAREDHTHGSPALAHHEIRDEGVDQGDAGTLDFVGAGVTASVAGGVATITVSGGGGGGDEPTVSDWFLS